MPWLFNFNILTTTALSILCNKRVTILAQYSWQIEHFKYLTTNQKVSLPYHWFCYTVGSPGVKSFLFYDMLLFLIIKFFKPAGSGDIYGGCEQKLCNHFHILFAQSIFCCWVQKFSQTLGIPNRAWTLFTLCYHFGYKSNRITHACQ